MTKILPTIMKVALVLSVSACSTPGSRPEDMTMAGHEAAAEEHAAEAAEHAEQFDEAASAERRVIVGTGADFVCIDVPVGSGSSARCYDWQEYNPTEHHLRSAERHEKMARDHAAGGAALERYEEGACKLFEPKQRASCPLLGQLEKVDRLPKGVRLTPKADVNVEAWQAHIACHLAFSQAEGIAGMEMCPLAMPGVRAVAVGNIVEITSEDPVIGARLLPLAQAHAD